MRTYEDGKIVASWFRLLGACARKHPEGFFWQQFTDYFVGSREELDGRKLDVTDHAQLDQFDHAVRISLKILEVGRLLSVEQKVPPQQQKSSLLKLRLLPEPNVILTKRGQRVLKWSDRAQTNYLTYAVARVRLVAMIARFKVPIAVLSFAFSVLKLVFQWNSIAAGVTAAAAAALAAVTVALSPSS